jgi:mercuric ion transport protein
MGATVIVGVLGALGLSWLRQDAILWPLMFASLAIAGWGFLADRRRHRRGGPLLLATAGSVALIAGVVFVHGFPARELIYGGSGALVLATIWNVALRRTAIRASPDREAALEGLR